MGFRVLGFRVYGGYIGRMEKKMETTICILYKGYMGLYGVIGGPLYL